jgi:PST family polysaccharide transporter
VTTGHSTLETTNEQDQAPHKALARGARGGGAIVFGQFTKLAIQLTGVMVLSRLLSPDDFGLVAMVAVFLAAGDLFRDFGLPTAALQAKTLTHQQASNLFWANSSLGLVAAAAVAALTPWLVTFYSEPRLEAIVPVMAATLALNGAQAQAQVQLARAAMFKAIAMTEVMALSIGLIVGIGAAVLGLGYWALVIQLLTNASALLVLRSIAAGWRPLRPRRGHDSGVLLRNGSDFGLAQVLAFAASNVDTFLIGRVWGSTSLGLYNRGFQLYMIPRSGMLDPLTRVVVPTVNAAATEGRRGTEVLLRLQFTLSALLTWIYLVLAVGAESFVPLALGGQWTDLVGVFRALAVGGAFATFGSVSYWGFIVEDKSRQLLRLHLVTKPISVLLIAAAAPLGIQAVAIAHSLGLAIAWPINLLWLARSAGQDSWAFFRVGCRVLSAGGLAYLIGLWLVNAAGAEGLLTSGLAGGAAASVVYLSVLALAPGGRSELVGSWRLILAATRDRKK